MVDSVVSCSVPGPHSNRDSVEQIARNASTPIEVESLSEALAKPILPRSAVFFGRLGDVLDEIAANYPDLYWWVSENGLNMASVDPNHVLPDPFDELAGSLTIQHWKNGKLSAKSLLEIARTVSWSRKTSNRGSGSTLPNTIRNGPRNQSGLSSKLPNTGGLAVSSVDVCIELAARKRRRNPFAR